MNKIIIAAAALFTITASAHAETYNVEGVTIHVGAGCRSSSCVSVDAPGYGSYHGHAVHARKAQKDTTRVAAVRKDDAAPTPAAAAPAAAPATESAPAKTPDAAPAAAPLPAASDAVPAK
jgi:hypothetical protein